MRKTLCITLLALVFGASAAAETWSLGFGSHLFNGYPTGDLWVQGRLGSIFGLRYTTSVVNVSSTTDLIVSLTATMTPFSWPFSFTVGGGPAGLITVGSSSITGIFAVDGFVNTGVIFTKNAGVGIGLRFLGFVSGGSFSGTLLPGFHVWFSF